MKISFVGAGRAACGLGKYFCTIKDRADVEITGYYSLLAEDAIWAAAFTDSRYFESMEEAVAAGDTIILSTPDGAIKKVWESMSKNQIRGKMICHLSGSLSSDVFTGIEEYGAYPISVHPFVAFSDKESVYQQLNQVSFTLEGHPYAVSRWEALFDKIGNAVMEIGKEQKPVYHAAASMLSNHVIAVLEAGYELLEQCGFSPREARQMSSALVRHNVDNVINAGSIQALTGPIERGDVGTVAKHLSCLNPVQGDIYKACGRQLISIAREKNPTRDYQDMEALLNENEK